MAELRHVEGAAPLHEQPAGRLLFLEPGDRRLEVARIGQAVGADRPAIGKRELGAVVLADIAAHRTADQLDLEDHAARDDAHFARPHLDDAHLGDEADAAFLRHDQQLAVGIEEMIVDHRDIGDIDMRRHADLGEDVAGRGHGADAGQEVRLDIGHRHRVPAQLSERKLVVADVRRRLPARKPDRPETCGVPDARADAVEPGALVGAARRGEGRTGKLFGIEPVGRPLRRIAALRQRAWKRLRLEIIAEAGHVGIAHDLLH